MFLENANKKGWIEVVCGSMFSGKTEELIRRLKRAQFAHLKVEIFKPKIDVRYSEEEVVSHDSNAIRSTPVESPQNILLMTSEVDVVGIDEAQFFDESIVEAPATTPCVILFFIINSSFKKLYISSLLCHFNGLTNVFNQVVRILYTH